MRYGVIPPEPAPIVSLDDVAPLFRQQVIALMQQMREGREPCRIAESIRTAERQAWLYGFGRSYDDGRGIVTNVQSIWTGWHPHGLAVDIVHLTCGWNVPQSFWDVLHNRAQALGLAPAIRVGASTDNPHIQWGKCRVTPSFRTRVIELAGGRKALWRAVGAA